MIIHYRICYIQVSYPRVLADHPTHRVSGLTWHLDLMPTVLTMLGLSHPPGLGGLDLTPMLRGRAEVDDAREIFPLAQRPPSRPYLPPRRLALRGRHKWIEGDEFFGDADGFLFDLAADPGEERNLRGAEGGLLLALEQRAESYVEDLGSYGGPVHQETGRPLTEEEAQVPLNLSEEELQRLRDLGYMR